MSVVALLQSTADDGHVLPDLPEHTEVQGDDDGWEDDGPCLDDQLAEAEEVGLGLIVTLAGFRDLCCLGCLCQQAQGLVPGVLVHVLITLCYFTWLLACTAVVCLLSC